MGMYVRTQFVSLPMFHKVLPGMRVTNPEINGARSSLLISGEKRSAALTQLPNVRVCRQFNIAIVIQDHTLIAKTFQTYVCT